MFVSRDEVAQMTGGYQVATDQIAAAQAIIEVYVGRTEFDINDPRDYAMLGRAVAFQAVYMLTTGAALYEQVDAKSMTVGGANYTFRENTDAPYIAPYAVKACKNLSWLRARGVKTGAINPPSGRLLSWWTED